MSNSIPFEHGKGYLRRGDIVRFVIDRECYIFVMDYNNFQKYCKGRANNSISFSYLGEYAKNKITDIIIPNDGNWYWVADTVGLEYTANWKSTVIRPNRF